jgi:choline dehydrogenase-like flavoprotein
MTEPSVIWGYKSTPQHQLNGQVFDCHRGRGLGQSSAINFGNWPVGDKEDYSKWAETVGDPDWKWEGERGVRQLRKIERQHVNLTEQHARYLDRKSLETNSKYGMVDLTFDQEWPEVGTLTFEAAKEWGVGPQNHVFDISSLADLEH